MIRSSRKLTSLVLAATVGLTVIGISPASAGLGDNNEPQPPPPGECQIPADNSGFGSFLPDTQAGGFKTDMNSSVFITRPGSGAAGGRESWERLFANLGFKVGEEVVCDFNRAQDKAERRFDRRGKGDTSSTEDNEHFKTEKVRNGYAVISTSGAGVVGVYDSEEKAKAVANALESEMDEQEEAHKQDGDPCILIFDPRTEFPGSDY